MTAGWTYTTEAIMAYRAAYWTDGHAELVLTAPEHAELPDEELLAEARAEAERAGVDLSDGWIEIGDWTDPHSQRPFTTEAIMARTIRIKVSYRPAYFNRVAFAWIPPCFRAELLDGGRPDRLPTHDGETADEAVRLLCESHGLDPSRVEIVRP